MTNKLITAATDILASINRDLANRPNFTMTHAQLDTRIADYCDDPSIDRDALRDLITPPIRCFRD
jgi:hypothetical protein